MPFGSLVSESYENASQREMRAFEYFTKYIENIESTSAGRLTVLELMLEMIDNKELLWAFDFFQFLPAYKLKPKVLQELKSLCLLAFQMVEENFLEATFEEIRQ